MLLLQPRRERYPPQRHPHRQKHPYLHYYKPRTAASGIIVHSVYTALAHGLVLVEDRCLCPLSRYLVQLRKRLQVLSKLAWSRKNKLLSQLHRSMTSKFSSSQSDRDSTTTTTTTTAGGGGSGPQAAPSTSSARQSRDGGAAGASSSRPRPSTATSRGGGFASDERSTRGDDEVIDYVDEEENDGDDNNNNNMDGSGSDDVEIEDITDAPQSQPTSPPPPRSPPNYSRPRPSHSQSLPQSPERALPPPPPRQSSSAKKKKTLPGDPAYVAPIGKIGPIGSIPKLASSSRSNSEKDGISVSADSRPQLPSFIGSYLKGKPVDEYGDIIDPSTGTILARAGGDLPSIVGRQVSNSQGDILGDEGELLGYVADIEVGKKAAAAAVAAAAAAATATERKPMMSLAEVMNRNKAALMVDHEGNILDAQGNVVGKFLDKNNPMHRERQEKEDQRKKGKGKEREEEDGEDGGIPAPQPQYEEADEDESGEVEGEEEEEQPQPQPSREQSRPPRRTEEERRANAAAWRKENPGESPSDIFLDVKSTTEGIQLTIRIPTVFGSNGQQLKPNISFS